MKNAESVFVKGVSLAYPDDELSAGISVAYVRDKKLWYASICRYPERDGEKKVVATACSKISLEHARMMLLYSWTRKVSKSNPRSTAVKKKLATAFAALMDEAREKALAK